MSILKNIKIIILTITFILLFREVVFSSPTIYPTGTTIYKQGFTNDGNTLYTANGINKVLLINMSGEVIHEWIPPNINLDLGYSEPLPNGNILVFAKDSSAKENGFNHLYELDWNSNVVWEYFTTDILHHDFERLINGNTLLLCTDVRVVPFISPLPIRDNYIIEVDSIGSIVWEWHTYEHFEELGFSAEAKNLIALKGGDYVHTNSIQSLPDNSFSDARFKKGNILVSQRNTNIIFIIDKDTGQIAWKVGPDDNLSIGQHSVKMISLGLIGAGNILVFDNGGTQGYPEKSRFYSRVIEVNPNSKQIAREYNASKSHLELYTFFSTYIGGADRLPNGNTLINEGQTGRFFEITPDGTIVWEYINPFAFDYYNLKVRSVYRIWRMNLAWP